MDLLSSMRISATGLTAQSTRLETIASNMANAESVGYKRKDPVMVPSTDREAFGEILKDKMDEHAQGVLVSEIHEDVTPPRLEYRPTHPQARPDGYVEMPNVNPIVETANMVAAQRAYEANITAINAAKAMAMKALDIGK
ncbi:MAG TPA: flagellar basal body rod protein FlgC [Bdellovibrionota bacterium]|jgi:flagellar basal-body rod protein FlgC